MTCVIVIVEIDGEGISTHMKVLRIQVQVSVRLVRQPNRI